MGGVRCNHCDGEGRVPVGEFGSHYRDGEKYDPPGWEPCEDCGGSGLAIYVEHCYPPIPLRERDYRATTDDYEPGQPVGYGPTKEAAIADLLEQLQ